MRGFVLKGGPVAPKRFRPEVRDAICESLRKDGEAMKACAAVGLPRGTFYRWLDRGARGEPGYAEFREAVTLATAEGIARILGVRRPDSSDSVAC
jgi:hypothetical protein